MAKKYFKKALSMGLALTLCLSLAAPAFAAEGEEKTDVNGAFDQVVDEIKGEFIDPDQKNAEDLNDGVEAAGADTVASEVGAANGAATKLENDLKGTVGKVTEQEFEMVEKPVLDEEGNPVLDEEGNPVTELVPQAKGDATVNEQKTLDKFMGEKATTAAEAAEVGKNAVDAANEAMKGLEDLVKDGKTGEVKKIADTVKAQAEAADQAYQEAAKAHAQAEAALNAAKEQYNTVIDNALKAAVEAGKVTEDALKDMTDEQKAEKAIALAGNDLTAAQTALDTAKQTLTALDATRKAAANAKTIADKYSGIADALEKKGDALTKDDVVTILLGLETWKVENKDILASLDEKGIDNNGLADTAVDYALAQKGLEAANEAKDAFQTKNSENAQKVTEINNAITEAKGLIEALKNAKVVGIDKGDEFNSQLNRMSSCLDDLQNARKVLQDPTKTAAEKAEAQSKQDAAMKVLFEDDGNPGLLGQKYALVDRFYQGVQGDGGSSHRWDYLAGKDHDTNVENTKKLCALLMGETVNDHSGSVMEKEQALKVSNYDSKLSDVLKGVIDAQDALDRVDLDAALNAYLATIGAENGANAADAATKAAQLAAVLRGISDKAVEDAQAKADKAAQAAQDAATNLANAQKAYDDALSKLNGITVNGSVTGVGMQKLFDKANRALIDAKAALDAAKDKKDEADQKKDEADKAVDDAEENRRRIDELTGGGDFDDTGVTIGDQVIPLASGPVTRAQFIDYLWRHEGSPAAEGELFADHEYAPAIAWALSFELIDETFQPDELVTVADVRAILGSFAQVFGTNAVSVADLTTLTGGDGEAVMNCDQVLAEFFGEEYLLPEDLDSLETDDAA